MSSTPHRSLSERLAAGGWPVFVLEFVVLAVLFGWLFITVHFAHG
jgi:hypothetical protein